MKIILASNSISSHHYSWPWSERLLCAVRGKTQRSWFSRLGASVAVESFSNKGSVYFTVSKAQRTSQKRELKGMEKGLEHYLLVTTIVNMLSKQLYLLTLVLLMTEPVDSQL